MKEIELNNPEVKEILDNFLQWFKSIDTNLIKLKGVPDTDEYYTGEEYFEEVNKPDHVGFPEDSYGQDLTDIEATPIEWRDKIRKLDEDLKAALGSPTCAVKMYYPSNGFMGWHNNWNCPGYNILFSHTDNGKGFFRYKNPTTNETFTIPDKPRWTAKVGYYGSFEEHDKENVYWHCARAYEDRLTLGFVIPDENMWEMMIEDISEK